MRALRSSWPTALSIRSCRWRAKATLAELQRLGCDVRWHTYGMPHSVCAEEVADISRFLREVLS